MTRVLLIGDIGLTDGMFHVGDEGMFAGAVSELSKRGVTSITATSTTPAETSARYGVDAILRVDFSAERTPRHVDREDRLDRVVRAARGETGLLDWKDPAWAVIEHIADADAILVCGGGNLSSSWPEHVYERVAIARLSKVFSARLIVSGQTLGPALTQRDGELVAEILATAALIGVREGHSDSIARALGEFPALARTIDDAAFLAAPAAGGPKAPVPGSYCLATFASYTGSIPLDDFARRIAQFLDEVVSLTDLDIVLLPHHGTPGEDGVDGDGALHRRIAAAMTSDRVAEWGVCDPELAAELARSAGLSVSTRYHPAVFALAGGTPAITFSSDEYTDVKLAGGLENFGFVDGALSTVALATDDARDMLAKIWSQRDRIRGHLAGVTDTRRIGAEEWWDVVTAVIRGDSAAVPAWSPSPECRVMSPRLRERNSRLRAFVRDEGRARVGAEIARRGSSDDSAALRSELLAMENALGEARADAEIASQRAAEAEAALHASQALLAEIAEPHFERTLRAHPTVVHVEELEAMRNSKTFRWTRVPRAGYGRVRRWLGR